MVGTLIVAAAAGTTAAGVAASFALTAAAFAVNFAISSIVSRVFGQSQQGPQDSGTREQIPPSNTNAIPIVYGKAYLGGTFVDAVLTTNQRRMYYVMAVSCISPNGQFSFDLTDMYYGDRKIVFDGTEPGKVAKLIDEAGNEDTKIAGNLFIYCFTSNAAGVITPINSSGTLPSGIMSTANGVPSGLEWPSSGRQMNGLAFAIVVLNYNTDGGTTSLSPVTFYCSQYLNGTGAAKPGDVWYDYITSTTYGGAVNSAFVDANSATALNTYSDQVITYTPYTGGSATQARYRLNGVIDAGQTVLSNLDKIMSCCDSWMAYNAASGKWSVVINKAETAAYSFNDNNIIGEIRVSATDITQSINQVEAKFPNGAARDQPDFVNLATPSGLLYPNEPTNKYSISYDLINDSVRAQYLANRILEQAREDLIVSFSTTYYGIQVDAGDVVSVTNTDYGWTNKLFRVVKVNEASLPDGSLGARLEMTEYSAAVYDDASITQYTPVPNSNIPSAIYFSTLAAPVVTASRPSASIPSFDIRVYVPTTGRVTYGSLFYTTSTTPGPLDWQIIATVGSPSGSPATNGAAYYWNDLTLPAGTYYFAFLVGNNLASSGLSPTSSAFVWNPVGMVGPAGQNGLTAITAYKVQSQSSSTPTFTTPTSGSTAPSGWTLTTPSVPVGQVLWYIQGRYNSGTVTIDGVAPNTTAWTGPIAASIFQDIRSDNWNGSTPPTYGSPGTYGTQGYYISQSTGNCYFNNGIFRGDISGASGTFSGDLVTTGKLSLTGSGNVIGGFNVSQYINSSASYACIYANNSGNAPVMTAYTGNARAIYAQNNSSFSGYSAVVGDNLGNGAGVQANSNTGTALVAYASSGSAFSCQGSMQITSSAVVTNLNADLLDGNHASAFVTSSSGDAYAANRLNGSAGTNVLRFVQGTVTGSATASFPGNNKPGSSSSAVWIQITIDGTTLYIPAWT